MGEIRFSAGTLEFDGVTRGERLPTGWRWDERTACHRAPASAYAEVIRHFARAGTPLTDRARAYDELAAGARVRRAPRPYQEEALAAWSQAQGRGVVVLPTGAGKTEVAVMAIDLRRRSTLVVAPTLDLVRQWYDILRTTFATEIGLVGGGEHDPRPLTVTTYDSAYLHMAHLGNRFGLIVFDECHHLPGEVYAQAALLALAPYRLGLTATPERADGKDARLAELIGPVVYRLDVAELAGDFLADYETVRLEVELGPEERAEYDVERAIYRDFVRQNGIRMSDPAGWGEFIRRAAGSDAGQRALRAYRRQRETAFAAPAKLDYLEHLLAVHRRQRTLVFTQDNHTAYAVSRRFLVPAITHQTPVKERSQTLASFAAGEYGVLVGSRVLNEGVDVPEASVAVVLSGSGSVREHVQRLGRILRPGEGKRAVLYEIVSADTSETHTSERRRHHEAYRRSGETDAES